MSLPRDLVPNRLFGLSLPDTATIAEGVALMHRAKWWVQALRETPGAQVRIKWRNDEDVLAGMTLGEMRHRIAAGQINVTLEDGQGRMLK